MDCVAFCKGSKDARQDPQLQIAAIDIRSVSNQSNEKYKELRTTERKLEAMIRKCDSLRTKIDASKGDGRQLCTPPLSGPSIR